jgi:hypothetical protein
MASALAFALAGNVKGGAMRRRGDRHRQSALHGDATLKSQQLDRDLSLVVIHGDDAVQGAVARFEKNRVGGIGALDRQAASFNP